jgi:hypothetical protein
MKEFLKALMTEPNGTTPCYMRIFGAGSSIYGLAAHAYQLFWLHAQFDFQQFATGLGIMYAALGAALGMKKDSP